MTARARLRLPQVVIPIYSRAWLVDMRRAVDRMRGRDGRPPQGGRRHGTGVGFAFAGSHPLTGTA